MSETPIHERALHEANEEGLAEEIPLGQRLLDRPFLLLAAGLVVMFAFYTVWGVVEVMMLTEAPLP